MVKYREILRLRALGVSQRNTAHSCGCAASTVEYVEKRARLAGVCWPLPEEFTDEVIKEKINSKRGRPTTEKYPIDHEYVAQELKRRGMTLTLCWNEYCDKAVLHGAEPFQYSAFCKQHRIWSEAHSPSMHIQTKCAERIEVDWVGDKMHWYDPDTGDEQDAYVFVACLPWSQYIFAEAFLNMSEESWIKAHVNAFTFFEGTTPILVPDNCKTGVLKNTLNELIINEQYRRMAEYYGCAVVPARPKKPKDKASVESSVGLIERQAIAALRDQVFLSLEELNDALSDKVHAINARPFQKREGSRISEYLGQEKAQLMPLPKQPYRMVTRRRATVQFNYHIAFDSMFYSVPHTYLRREVEVCATSSCVEIACDGIRIATHKRLHGHKGQYSTNTEHMPDTHRDFAEWTGDRFRRWAKTKGKATECVIDGLLRSKTIEQQAYRSCRALLDLGRKYGGAVLESACQKALEYKRNPSYSTVKKIAITLFQEASNNPEADAYLRGSDYFNTDKTGE